MRIYRIAAMFKTFGLEEKLSKSFKHHYAKFLRAIKDPSMRSKAQRQFKKNKEIYLGAANIGNLLKPIIEHYGQPKVYPKRVFFVITHPDNAEGAAASFVLTPEEGWCFLSKTASDFKNIKFDSTFEDNIAHETQHLLKAIYYGEMTDPLATGKGKIADYYADEWEIQSYAMNVAKGAVRSIEGFIRMAIEGKPPERIEAIKNSMMNNKTDLIKTFLSNAMKDFFKGIEERTKETFTPELRKQYYQAAIRDFNTLFDTMIASL